MLAFLVLLMATALFSGLAWHQRYQLAVDNIRLRINQERGFERLDSLNKEVADLRRALREEERRAATKGARP